MAATTRYPVVLIHGLFGYGNAKPLWNAGPPYWPQHVIDQINTNTITLDVGTVSSDHDRACEAFYQLYGGTVDYGEAHANETRHARFGRTYDRGLYPTWSAEDPIHLVGHSMGSTTAIDLYQLICEDFFSIGTDHRWVRSITCIAGPLTGTLLSHTLDLHGDEVVPFTSAHVLFSALSVYFKLYHIFPTLRGFVDLKMDQWSDEPFTDVVSTKSQVLRSLDLAMFSCQPARRILKNSQLKHMDKVYLMSITTSPRYFTIAKREVIMAAVIVILLVAKRSLYSWLSIPQWLRSKPVRRGTATLLLVWLWRRATRWNLAKMPSLSALAWLMQRCAKSLHKIYDGFDPDHWQHNDGAVNIHSMLRPWFPKPQELATSRSSVSLSELAIVAGLKSSSSATSLRSSSSSSSLAAVSRCQSHISIDGIYRETDYNVVDDEDEREARTSGREPRFHKGRWYVYRVDCNHFAGTYWDKEAADLYRSLFMMIIDEYERKPQDAAAKTSGVRHTNSDPALVHPAMIG